MSSTSNHFFDVANLRMLDRILRKSGFRGGETRATDEGEIQATNFLIQSFLAGNVDEAALRSALKMHIAMKPGAGPIVLSRDDASLARWQDDGGAPLKSYRITRYTAAKYTSAPLRPGGYRFPKATFRD
jgi:hypothetical protein